MKSVCQKCGKVHRLGETCISKKKKITKKQERQSDFAQKYSEFMSSFKWKNEREDAKRRSWYLCAICALMGRYDGKRKWDKQELEVHHIEPLKEAWERRTDRTNIIALCREHHEEAEKGLIARGLLHEVAKNPPLWILGKK